MAAVPTHGRASCLFNAGYHHCHGEWSQRFRTTHRSATIRQVNLILFQRCERRSAAWGHRILERCCACGRSGGEYQQQFFGRTCSGSRYGAGRKHASRGGITNYRRHCHYYGDHHGHVEWSKRPGDPDPYASRPTCFGHSQPVQYRWRYRCLRDRDHRCACDQ